MIYARMNKVKVIDRNSLQRKHKFQSSQRYDNEDDQYIFIFIFIKKTE